MKRGIQMKTHNNLAQQTGAVLVVSMVILVSLTMLGVTSMKGALTELTMAGNLRESGLTFQAAEAGLVFSENLIQSTTSKTEFNGTTSLLDKSDVDPDYMDKASWDNATEASVSLEGISVSPKYIIRYIGDRNTNANADIAIGGYGKNQSGTILSNFRVTSRGAGQTGNYFRVVQSYYAREY